MFTRALLRRDRPVPALATLLHKLLHTPAYLRHASPSLYVTTSTDTDTDTASRRASGAGADEEPTPLCGRFRHHTQLLDTACTPDRPPHCEGVYLLSSAPDDDILDRADPPSPSSSLSISSSPSPPPPPPPPPLRPDCTTSALIDLPRVRDAAEACAFVDRHAEALASLQMVILPALDGSHGCMMRVLRRAFPTLTVYCSPFAAAFFTDLSFCRAVRDAIAANDGAARAARVVFADLPSAAVVCVRDGQRIELLTRSGSGGGCGGGCGGAGEGGRRRMRELRLCEVAPHRHSSPSSPSSSFSFSFSSSSSSSSSCAVDEERSGATGRKSAPRVPNYFTESVFCVADPVFSAVHVGCALARWPWLPLLAQLTAPTGSVSLPTPVARGASLAQIVPIPPPLMAARGGACDEAPSCAAATASRSLRPHRWRAEEYTNALLDTLAQHRPAVARVLCGCYGELPGSVSEWSRVLQESAAALDGLRSGDAAAGHRGGILDAMMATMRGLPAGVEVWARDGPLGDLATALARSAAEQPPEPPATAPRTDETSGGGGGGGEGGTMGCVRTPNVIHTEETDAMAAGDDGASRRRRCLVDHPRRRRRAGATERTSCCREAANRACRVSHTCLTDDGRRSGGQRKHADAVSDAYTQRGCEEEEEDGGGGGGDAAAAAATCDDVAGRRRTAEKDDLGGRRGVALLQAVFEKKGWRGLGGVLDREDIDVHVFLAMSSQDLRRVFKATWGVVQKLERLQQEMRVAARGCVEV